MRRVLAVLLVALIAGVFFFSRLGLAPLERWDEGIHGSVSLEMQQSHTWLSMSYHHLPYWAKPPLKFWLTTPLFAVFGTTEYAVRFWSAVAGVLTAMLLAWWVTSETNTATVGFLAGAVFTLGRFIFYHSFRTGETDGLLVLLFVFAMYAGWRMWAQRRWWIGFGIATGLLFMTKQLFGLLPFAVLGLDFIFGRGLTKQRFLDLIQAFVLALMIALPWHLLMTIRYGHAFWSNYIGFNVAQRANETLYHNNVSWYWYVTILRIRFFPFIIFLPLAFLTVFEHMWQKGRSIIRQSFLWAVIVFTLFTVVKTKFDWYILPIYPALIILLVLGMKQWWQKRHTWMLVGLLLSIGLMWWEAPLRLVHTGLLWKLTPFAYAHTGNHALIAFAAPVLAGMIFFLWKKSITKNLILLGSFGLVFGMAAWWSLSFIKHLPITSPAKTVAAQVDAQRITQLDVVGVDLYRNPDLYFYLRRIPNLVINEKVTTPVVGHAVLSADSAGVFTLTNPK